MDIVLISPVSPFDPRDGHRLAILSDVRAILDNDLSLGVISFSYGGESDTISPLCANKVIPVQPGGGLSRFLRGMAKGLPPSAERLYGSRAKEEIRAALVAWAPQVVIIDDASVAGYIPMIRDLLPRTRVVLRSHNVMNDVRSEQLRRTKGLAKPAIQLDCERYIDFERKAVESCDEHWAITQADADRMTSLYGRPSGHLTVSIPLERYESLATEQGRTNGFVHVGTVDFRRRADLGNFLSHSWPKILGADAEATLTFAGAVHGRAISATNVSYAGKVANDADVYRLGRFSLNFQSSTGGVKLKTLTSLAAGRTLISTPEGVEGLPLHSGKHYWDIATFLADPNLTELLRDDRVTRRMADAGRQYAATNHSRAALARQLSELLSASPVAPSLAREPRLEYI